MHPRFLWIEMLGFEVVGRRAVLGAASFQNQAEPDKFYKNDLEKKIWWRASG